MKIYYPNCSELVSHLGITKIEDIREVLKEVERITGWKVYWKKWIFTNKIDCLFKKTNLDRLNIDYTSLKFIEKYTDKKDCILREIFNEVKDSKKYSLVLLSPNKRLYISIQLQDGYCNNIGLMFELTQHCCRNEFPPLAKIIRHFNAIWHIHDGGSPQDFEDWCIKNGYTDIIDNFEY